MLWEAIRGESSTVISKSNIRLFLHQYREFYVFTELLLPDWNVWLFRQSQGDPSVFEQQGNIHTEVNSSIEPLYFVNKYFTQLIVLTTENLPNGDQLCVLVHRLPER